MIPFREEIEKIKNQIVKLYNPYEIILFGSCARGRARKDSDIDICIVLDFEDKRELLLDLTMKIESTREIDFIVYTKSSWEKNIADTASFASLIQKTGVKIYPMTTRSNTPASPSGSKERLRPWITISKHQVKLKLHLMPRTLFMVDTLKYNEWFIMGNKDLKGAKILYEYDGDLGLVCFHLQQAVEKYMKGFLIYKTGILQNGHNLFKLCKTASMYDKEFNKFLKDSAFLNAYYIETRYPAEEPLVAEKEDVHESLRIAENIIEYIKKIETDK